MRATQAKAGNILQEDGDVVTKTYYFNLMVSYLYSFNPFIGIKETASTSAAWKSGTPGKLLKQE